jgi:hypothetical protein
MQEPTEENQAPIPTASVSSDPNLNVRDGQNLNRAVEVRRKAANRTLPWDLAAGELDLMSPPPQAEDVPARKKRRLKKPFSASTDEASPDTSVGLPPSVVDNDDVNVDPMTDTQPNIVATSATGHWTIDEDAQLASAVTNTSKKKYGREYKTDWAAVTAPALGRTKTQCCNRWYRSLDPSIDRTNGRSGKWTAVEDTKLKDAVKMHGFKGWVAVASLIPGRTRK